MNICIPVDTDHGLDSPVCAHFGSAPGFLVVDTDAGDCRFLPNRNQHHGHGACQPLASLAGERIDGVVVGGIGRGAVARLQAAGIEVFMAEQPTVREAIAALGAGSLRRVTPASACAHHGHGHGRARGGSRQPNT